MTENKYVGYDEKPPVTGNYLRLKGKGDKAQFRIVSEPFRFTKEYQGKFSTRFAWVVLWRDKESKQSRVMGYECGWMVYQAVGTLAKDEAWGDPGEYDIEVTRTEESPSKYYTVVPKPKTGITEDERQLIAEANLDPEAMYGRLEGQALEEEGYDVFADE